MDMNHTINFSEPGRAARGKRHFRTPVGKQRSGPTQIL